MKIISQKDEAKYDQTNRNYKPGDGLEHYRERQRWRSIIRHDKETSARAQKRDKKTPELSFEGFFLNW